MNRDSTAYTLAVVGALLGWAALALQSAVSIGLFHAAGGTTLAAAWRLAGYFTILTNLLVAVTLTHAALRRQRREGLGSPGFELAAATAIAMVGLVYSLLLRATINPQGWSKVADVMLHDAAPVLFVVYFLIRPRAPLSVRDGFFGVIFPLLYVVYALARGVADGWYAYWFLDPNRLGAVQMTVSVGGLTVAFLAMSFALRHLSNRLNANALPPSGESR